MILKGGQHRCDGDLIEQELKLNPQVDEGCHAKKDRDNWEDPVSQRRRGEGGGLGCGPTGHRRDSTGSRVGARPMLDQLPTAIPMLRAMANQNRLEPPNSNSPTSGSRVVNDV